MKEILKYWWMILIKGIILVLLSFFVFKHPVESLMGLTMYIGFALSFTGIALIINSMSNRKTDDSWGWKLGEGILDIVIAITLLTNPVVTAAVFPFIIGFWMIFYGIMIFVGAFNAKKSGDSNWWINLISGIVTILLGYLISSNLLVGAFTITFWIGLGLLLFGIVNIAMAINVKKLNGEIN